MDTLPNLSIFFQLYPCFFKSLSDESIQSSLIRSIRLFLKLAKALSINYHSCFQIKRGVAKFKDANILRFSEEGCAVYYTEEV